MAAKAISPAPPLTASSSSLKTQFFAKKTTPFAILEFPILHVFSKTLIIENCVILQSVRVVMVTWDEPETLLNMKRVNPWQVEYISPTSHLHPAFPPPKKFKALQNSEMITDGEEEFCFPMTELARSMAGHMNSPILNYYSPFPASIQGARQDQFCIPSSSNSRSDKSFQITQSTSVHLNGVDLVAMQGNNTSTKVGVNSFQLFGKIIHASDSVEGGSEANISCRDGETNDVFREGSSAGNPSPRQPSVAEFMIISKEPQL
ncbi:Auxin response factor 17 [Sesamum angolense]|uniref:Auxin response factor 17 n=1 Tax=Sesamum angolense TaxID=2727404 RepID=A0AAE1WD44_9LAMI|nr:Auxin response factor 17 [Sesamum angolense]